LQGLVDLEEHVRIALTNQHCSVSAYVGSIIIANTSRGSFKSFILLLKILSYLLFFLKIGKF